MTIIPTEQIELKQKETEKESWQHDSAASVKSRKLDSRFHSDFLRKVPNIYDRFPGRTFTDESKSD